MHSAFLQQEHMMDTHLLDNQNCSYFDYEVKVMEKNNIILLRLCG